jgi:uncharacterized membrane protein (DUF2068 family)
MGGDDYTTQHAVKSKVLVHFGVCMIVGYFLVYSSESVIIGSLLWAQDILGQFCTCTSSALLHKLSKRRE